MAELNRDTARMFAYHEATKHTPERLRAMRYGLDWANMPDPFRRYEGAPLVDLPAAAPAPAANCLEILRGGMGLRAAGNGPDFLASLFFHSAAISASKSVPQAGYRYSLRVNPSSGNLHPTEFHFVTRGLPGWADGIYHYQPASHTAEQRGRGDFMPPHCGAALLVCLSSIAWREAWKYGNRAYRYCLLDIGHAWQALVLAARALGARPRTRGVFVDAELQRHFALADEWPMLLVEIDGLPVAPATARESIWTAGAPNRLSPEQVDYPLIDAIHAASRLEQEEPAAPATGGACWRQESAASDAGFAAVVRGRRSALDFQGGERQITFAQLGAMLDAAARPLDCDWDGRWIDLYLFVHRVRGLDQGLYRWDREAGGLQLMRGGDHRAAAAALSLGQDLAGTSCVTFSMLAGLEEAARQFGNRAYRYVHFEAGAIGQRLYLAAEAQGFGCTGIGAFLDDRVHEYLRVKPQQGQVVYHLAAGFAVSDPRLQS